jgi:hypothetical protein
VTAKDHARGSPTKRNTSFKLQDQCLNNSLQSVKVQDHVSLQDLGDFDTRFEEQFFSDNYICAFSGGRMSVRDVHNLFEGGIVMLTTQIQVWELMKEIGKTGKIPDSASKAPMSHNTAAKYARNRGHAF